MISIVKALSRSECVSSGESAKLVRNAQVALRIAVAFEKASVCAQSLINAQFEDGSIKPEGLKELILRHVQEEARNSKVLQKYFKALVEDATSWEPNSEISSDEN